VSGFCHPTEERKSEIFIQGPPDQLVPVLRDVIALGIRDLIIEEARGFIPMIQPGFRVVRSVVGLEKMFSVCSAPVDGHYDQCWFYNAQYDPALVAVRYIDARA
jgi:hypothetical protein